MKNSWGSSKSRQKALGVEGTYGLGLYAFFLVHMFLFGGSGFLIAYSGEVPLLFLYVHGGFAILVYLVFYLSIFGLDEIKWMFINAGLSVLGIISQIDWILALFDKRVSDFPFYVHIIPFLYFVLYTFLIRQALLDFTKSRNNQRRRRFVEIAYVIVTVVVYMTF